MSENTQLVESKPAPPTVSMNGRGVVLRNIDEAFRFAKAVHLSGLAPRSFNKPESILIAMQYGAELGLSPMQSLANIAVVNGKACVYGDGLKAVVEASPVCQWIQETVTGQGEQMAATCKAQRVGRPEPTVRTFSAADAKRAKLWGKSGPWTDYPQRMLQMRARAWCLRDQFADLLCGMGVVEEVQDIEPQPVGLQSGDDTPASDLDEIVSDLMGETVAETPEQPAAADAELETVPAVAVEEDEIPW